MSKKPRRTRQVRDREIKRLARERGISHTAALRIVDAERDTVPLSAWEPPKPEGVHVWDEKWNTQSTPFTPPPGVAPRPDPYGHAHPVSAGAYLLTFTVPDQEDEIYEVKKAIVYAHRFLVRPGVGWYRVAASVYGPLPITMPYTSGAEPAAGHVTLTVLVTPYARTGSEAAELMAFMDDSVRAARTAVLDRFPVSPELEPEWFPADPETGDGIRERLEPSTLSWRYLHPTLADLGPAFEAYPERLVDLRCRGWQHIGQGRYRVDQQEQRGLPERTYDQVAAIDGPLSVVEPPNPYNAEDFVAALEAAGTRAAASLLVALHQLADEYDKWFQKAGEVTCSLTAGAEESWQSETMMAQVRTYGEALAGQSDRTVEEAVTALREELEGWTGVSQAYTEVAENLARLFSRAADGTGGWSALADPELQAVDSLRDWLMSHSKDRPTEA
ncbi:hypothetical protein [Streptomyces fuscichromogenes]|uniref:Uncharacterized protein n=1 Tax=Streptomyces fuscichromogenes TaxID=1324013 RepID=A0A917XQ49_9ACTN|nr:hypothetical protein [Streptomyces fuscichromogenes]GGN46733.1 hypothetical protein GCM10011578_099820 [Streptomyces fuscichromogenes]